MLLKKARRKFTLRRMSLDDIRDIFNVRVTIWLEVYPNERYGVQKEDVVEKFFDEEKYLKKIEERIKSHGKSKMGWVALDNNRIIGFSEVSVEGKASHLETIYVLSGYQGLGIGRAFIEKVLEFAPNSEEILVKVIGYNQKAIDFYKRMGFYIVDDTETHELIKGKNIHVPSITMKKKIPCT